MFDLAHDLIEAAGVATPIVIYLWASKSSARKENEGRFQTNQRRFDELIEGQKYLKPHDHIEETGSLMAEGIIRKKNGE